MIDLKEIIEVLRRGQSDEQEFLASRLEDELAKPAPDAMEIVDRIRDAVIQEPSEGFQQIGYILTDERAAALIKSRRVVPRALLEEILDEAWNCLTDRPEGNVLQKIAAKHGVKVEDAK